MPVQIPVTQTTVQIPYIMAQPPPVLLSTPMPMPGSPNAPLFRGEQVTDFLDSLEAHVDTANVPHGDLLGYVLCYCHQRVQQIIKGAEHWSQNNWATMCAYLIDLYSSSDQKPRNLPDRLRKWVRVHMDNQVFLSYRTWTTITENSPHSRCHCYLPPILPQTMLTCYSIEEYLPSCARRSRERSPQLS